MAVFSLFGYNIVRKETPQDAEVQQKSFVEKTNDDGSAVIAASGSMGAYVDLSGQMRSEAELIDKYRAMALSPEIEQAKSEIVNEAIVVDEKDVVKLDLDDLAGMASDPVKEAIETAFEEVLHLLEFNEKGYYIFDRWYTDGRLNYHTVIDENATKDGIKELRYVDPRKIRKIREVERVNEPGPNGQAVNVVKTKAEYYMYNESGFSVNTTQQSMTARAANPSMTGLRIATDAIVSINSGVTDESGTLVLSYLHKAIKPLNVLRAIEDAMVIYRLARAAERRVWYIDTGNMPKAAAEQYVKSIMDSQKNQVSYNAADGSYTDKRKFLCYSLDTKIPLLDGRTLTLQQLMNEYEAGKQNWVYSCDPVTGKFVPGPVSWAGITKNNAEVVRVTFDNGESVVCTPDHKFPVWDKGFVEAKDLVGESIIPGYRRKQKMWKSKGGRGEYEQIFKNDTKTWEYTHREVAKWKDSVGIREEKLHLEEFKNLSKRTVHHVDYDRFNNDPSNLVMMNSKDHIKYHWDMAKFGAGRRKNKSEDFTPIWKARLSKAAKARKQPCKSWKITSPDGEVTIIENLSEFCRNHELNLNRSNIKGRFGSLGYRAEELRNHKAISVEYLNERIDVGCITVDLEETYHSHHTYLLDAGVYTKNTMLEDFYLPRKEGSRGTEVQTLPSAQNLAQMDDVEYFQKKLYNALHVPITRLQPGDAFTIGRATEISRDEVSFGKFITKLRTRFSGIFTQLLEKQLVLKQVMSIEDFRKLAPKIKYTYSNDTYFLEMKESEVYQNRVELFNSSLPLITAGLIPIEDALRDIMRKNDQEILELREKVEAQNADPFWQEILEKLAPPPPMMGGDVEGMGPDELPPEDPSMGGDPDGIPTQAADQFSGTANSEDDPNGKPPQQRRDFKLKKKPQTAKKE